VELVAATVSRLFGQCRDLENDSPDEVEVRANDQPCLAQRAECGASRKTSTDVAVDG
jgi:hypothetical protein